MTEDSARRELRLLRGVLDVGPAPGVGMPGRWMWVPLLLAACLACQWLGTVGRSDLILPVWVLTFALGSSLHMWLRRRARHAVRATTRADRAFGSLWGAVFLTDFIILSLALAGAASNPVSLAFLAGFGLFSTGVIFGGWELYAGAVVWWLSGMAALVLPQHLSGVTAGAIIVGLLAPLVLAWRRVYQGPNPTESISGASPADDVQFVRNALADTDNSSGRLWLFLVIAGIAGSLAQLESFSLLAEGPSRYPDIWVLWMLVYLFNIVLLLLLGWEHVRGLTASFVPRATFRIFMGLNLTFLALSLPCWWFGVYVGPGDAPLMGAVAFFTCAAMLRAWPLYASAALYWVASTWMNIDVRSAVFIGAGLHFLGQVIPGLLMRGSSGGLRVDDAEAA